MEENLFILNFKKGMLKKILFNITIVGVVVFILDFTIGKTLRHFYFKETSGVHYRTTYSIEKTIAETLVFGSSRANHHYVPEIFEDSLQQTFYNTGRDGNGIFFQAALIQSVLKRYTPKTLILDYWGDFNKGQFEYDKIASLLPYNRTHKEIRKTVGLKSPFEKIKLASEIYPFNSQILTIALGNLETSKNRMQDNKGYVPLYNEWKAELDSIGDYSINEVDSNKVNALKDFIAFSKKSGAKIFVVCSPVFQKFNMRQEIAICEQICAAENIPFLNFSRDTFFLNNKSFFQDDVHLNHKGAQMFSKMVVTKVKQQW
jgi:hypothetical protein